jgi:hypothetical protein
LGLCTGAVSYARPMSRLIFRVSGLEAAGGFALLLLADSWYDALLAWLVAGLTYRLAMRTEQLEESGEI